ncbi:MAG: RNase adapter RapZ, partial [Desulfobacteraceae bacterium]
MNKLELKIITGLSGSGKSTAIDALEDVGYFCVDNMPVSLVLDFLHLRARSGSGVQKIALGMDLRQDKFVEDFKELPTVLQPEEASSAPSRKEW